MTRFISDPDIMGGDLCIEGTRIPVRAVWVFDCDGYSLEKIKSEYPTLTDKQIEDAIEFGASLHADFM